MKALSLMAVVAVMARPSLAAAQIAAPPQAAQNPSPMVEATRAHERLTPGQLRGVMRSFVGPAGKAVELFVPNDVAKRAAVDLVVHFHGAAWLPQQAVAGLGGHPVAAVVNLGTGSGTYHRAFSDPAAFDSLLAGVSREVSAVIGTGARVGRLTLVGFSAGHGAIRAILREPRHFATVDAVLLLDGMHTSYVPEGTVIAAGGVLDTTNLVAFAEFARAAMRGEKRFVVTHSEIFPGTFASTTETADWLLRTVGLRRTPVLRWGPRGMQQLSETRAGRFELLGFAGNSAPDHVDHLHAMPELLARASETAGAVSAAERVDRQRVRHYVYFNVQRQRISEPWFLASASFDGAQLKYTWPELEPEKDRYDFSGIRHDLALLRRNGKRLFIQLQDVSFHASIINAPRYLLTDTAYHGGIAGQYARDEDSTAKPAGYVARRWDPAVRLRFQKLLAALGQEFDGQIEGINLPETSVEFGTHGALFPPGFTPATYRDGVIDNIRALRRSFRASVAMQYANFMPGEWLPDDDKGYLKSVYAEARQLKLAMGGPDLRPLRRPQQNHTYAMLRAHRGVAPTGIAVQWGNYEDIDPQTGARITVAKLVDFASNTLGVNYIFWEPQEPFFGSDVLPFLERTR